MTKRRIGILISTVCALSVACGDDESSPTGPNCEAVCERIEAAQCSHAAPDCVAQCREDHESTKDSCQNKLSTLAACFEDARFTCDAQGIPVAAGCKDELSVWLDCNGDEAEAGKTGGSSSAGGGTQQGGSSSAGGGTQQGGSSSAGGGSSQGGSSSAGGGSSQGGSSSAGGGTSTPGSNLSCEFDADADADSCDLCLGQNCCAELQACGSTCMAMFACMESCADDDDACFEACFASFPSGADQATALSACVEQSCTDSCDFGDQPETAEPSKDSPDLSEICLDEEVPDGYCDGTGKNAAHDCPLQKPFADCVLSPTGAANVYCCDR